jgi:lipoprotein-anchoring transpeptidase ErfK/SrfK
MRPAQRNRREGAPGGFVRRALLALLVFGALAAPAAAKAPPAPKWSAVVTAHVRSIGVFERPGMRHPFLRYSSRNRDGAPTTFLVRGERRAWFQVYLPIRPNGSKGWVRKRDVTVRRDDYYLTVDRGKRRLTVYRSGRVIMRQPVGVGRSVLPTPRGLYYIVELLQQPNPAGPYGPYAFGLSGYSNVLYSFGGGPGQIGLHGTNEPASIGRDSSHGCIRLRNAVVTRLARMLPLGTPVRILS